MDNSSKLDDAIETVESLSIDDQEILISVIQRRIIEKRRAALADEIHEARNDLKSNDIQKGSVDDLMRELKK